MQLQPDMANAWDTRAVALNRLGRYEEAVSFYTRAVARDPQDPTYYTNRAYNFVCLRQFEQAIADCTTALKVKPEYWAAAWWQGVAYRFLDDPGRAVEPFETVCAVLGEREPKNPHRARAYLHLYVVLKEAGRSSEANELIQQAAARGSDFDDWGCQLIAFYAGGLKRDELLAAAGGDSRKLCQAYYYAGEAERLTGRQTKAHEWFQEAVRTGQRRLVECEFAEWRLLEQLK